VARQPGEAGGAPAYWPWIEALRPFAALGARANDAERARIAPLGHLLPELEGCEAPRRAADPVQDRFRLFEATRAFLSLVARERPLVVLLDDVHVADVGSLSLLHFVARQAHGSRVVAVATFRDVEARLSAEAGDALAKIAREGRYLALRRLEHAEVLGLAADLPVVVEAARLDGARRDPSTLHAVEPPRRYHPGARGVCDEHHGRVRRDDDGQVSGPRRFARVEAAEGRAFTGR
jgi:hypothetical protein